MNRQCKNGHGNKKLATLILGCLILLGLGVTPVHATVSGDVAAGLPTSQVVANAIAASLSIDAAVSQALAAGTNPIALAQAALAQPGVDPRAGFSAMLANNVPLATVRNAHVLRQFDPRALRHAS